MKVGIVGCGVIGGALLKACQVKGIDVVGYDPNREGLKDKEPILKTDLTFLCLPTPTVNGTQLLVALDSTLEWLESQKYAGAVVIRSTVLPGTVKALQGEYDLKLVHCPEFLTAASPFEDLIKQPVVLVGSEHEWARALVHSFWKKFDRKTPVKLFKSPTETELAKYMHNCFLAVKVSFFNDMFELCRALMKTGVVDQVMHYDAAVEGAVAVGQIGQGHTAVPGPDSSWLRRYVLSEGHERALFALLANGCSGRDDQRRAHGQPAQTLKA